MLRLHVKYVQAEIVPRIRKKKKEKKIVEDKKSLIDMNDEDTHSLDSLNAGKNIKSINGNLL